jgi:molybdopterin molybdotransferase
VDMLTFAEGMRLVEQRCGPMVGAEFVELREATCRILAEDLISPVGYPPADNSAVDGFAFNCDDAVLADTGQLRIAGTSAAGHPFEGSIHRGEALRIYTGALIPNGANAVVMQEYVTLNRDFVSIPAETRRASNIRHANEDFNEGTCVLRQGDLLGPARIGLLASLGMAKVKVRRRIKVAIISIGDELQPSGELPQKGKIYESNRNALTALLETMGAIPVDYGIVPDVLNDVAAALSLAAEGNDAIISTAGASVGGEDHVKDALKIVGEIDFAGLQMKPGRPMILGQVGSTPYFALPGNPVAALTCFALIVRLGLLHLAGATARKPVRIPLPAKFSMSRKSGTLEFLRGMLDIGENGPSVCLFPRSSTGSVSALAQCDGLIELDESLTEIRPGMLLPFIPLGAIGL